MIAALLVMLQAAAGPVADTPPPRRNPTRCPELTVEEGDIVVCGRPEPQEQFRLRPLTRRYDPVGGPGTGFRVGSGQGNVYAATQQSPDGKPDKRIMVTLKFPF
ncbi:MAG: hypothetical protein V4610_01020 [Pseudomonadota bacterium]|uniref:Uncharacterized protein n=1 Tax=hydrothermal vent metagenome TaxID=652676 RepID=A0A160TMK9_9ZZZZ